MEYASPDRKRALAARARGYLWSALPVELFALYLFGAYVTAPYPEQFLLELTIALPTHAVATVLAVAGCAPYAAAKGYPRALGVLGLLSVPGVGLLLLLPDHRPPASREPPPGTPPDQTNDPR